ncbi:UNVERIFIED_CONTAM: hypothetical protein GTU68_046324 [Idotea baltica]|nr:hypothetical protein [Idotea baltica]
MMAKTIIDKIWDEHIVAQQQGHPAVFAIDLMLIHEVTSAQAFDVLRAKGLNPCLDTEFIATLDHSIPTRKNRLEIYDDAARLQVETLRRNCAEFGISLFDFESGHQGIVHVIGPELGYSQPGMTIVCGDSHTSTHGAFGALAFGVGTSEVGHVLASEVEIDISTLRPMVTWGTNPGQGCGVDNSVPLLEDFEQGNIASVENALAYVELTPGTPLSEVKIDWAFIGSCTNGRIEDLRAAADVLRGRKVHSSVTMYIVPGSESVRALAIEEGLEEIFIAAGAEFRMPGCSMCLAMNDDKVPKTLRCISSSNRNFVGRQGPGSKTHLASPATVAASAVRGKISSVYNLSGVV